MGATKATNSKYFSFSLSSSSSYSFLYTRYIFSIESKVLVQARQIDFKSSGVVRYARLTWLIRFVVVLNNRLYGNRLMNVSNGNNALVLCQFWTRIKRGQTDEWTDRQTFWAYRTTSVTRCVCVSLPLSLSFYRCHYYFEWLFIFPSTTCDCCCSCRFIIIQKLIFIFICRRFLAVVYFFFHLNIPSSPSWPCLCVCIMAYCVLQLAI